MLPRDLARLSFSAIVAQRLRSLLTTLGIAVGIAAVALLTAIGSGIHHYILAEFTQFGTNLVAINPGRSTTFGISTGVFGTVHPLTLEDSRALKRVPHVTGVVPFVQGNAEVETHDRRRRINVFGTSAEADEVFRLKTLIGRFLPADDADNPRQFAVLGSKTRQELFGEHNPLGQRIRVGGERYRVIGVMEPKGQMLGIDLDDSVYIPTANALRLFNRDSLMEIDLIYREGAPVDEVVAGIKRILGARHGREDFTITTQQQMLDVLGNILDVLTFAVGALGGISLFVGGIGILTIMSIAVNERTREIGLLRALGARRRQVMGLFLAEAVVLAAVGGMAGLLLGIGGAYLLNALVPALPVHASWGYLLAAELLAVLIGILAGVEPARRAARLDPVQALRAE